MNERYTMDAQDLYDGDRPLRDTDICDRLNEQDDDLDRLRAELKASQSLVAKGEEVVEIVVAAVRLFNQAAHFSLQRATQAEQRERVAAAAYRELETLYQASQERALRAEGDAAALREALVCWIESDETGLFVENDEALADLARSLRDVRTDHPGAALLAELEAARAYLAYVRDTYPPTSKAEAALRAAYDAAVKAGQT